VPNAVTPNTSWSSPLEGRLSPTDATKMLRLIEARRRAIETRELEDRVAALEQCIPGITRKKAA